MYFDTHAHYDDDRFAEDREALLEALPSRGVGLILNPGVTVSSSRAALALAERFPHVWAAAGIHPEDCAGAGEADWDALRDLCRREKVAAIGEIGLDYHWEDNPSREEQQAVFRRQLALALAMDKPVIIHDRDAHADCLSIVSEFPGLRGVFHCFSGSAEMAEQLLRRGWYLGFDGPVTYKNAKKALAVLAVTPPERILLETDAPYLPPVPHRGERNDSRFLPEIARAVAAAKGMTVAEMEALTWENGRKLFGI
ncbi:MAG: TatD family hydrolase [Oscillospiraceae bacterium]|nr:TatD family hydrolase [Oscillospiraceae bacterium]